MTLSNGEVITLNNGLDRRHAVLAVPKMLKVKTMLTFTTMTLPWSDASDDASMELAIPWILATPPSQEAFPA